MSTTVDLGKITASVSVGTTTTGAAGTNASVSNSGTTQDAVLDFIIPRGAQGVQGPQGSTGPQGQTGIVGPQGPKGDSVTATDYTLYNVQGSDSQGAMSQDATTKAISAQTGYYTCSAAAGTAAKIATVESGNIYMRTLGGHFKVKMTDANTASNVTLQVGSEPATALYYNGAAASAENSWDAGEVLSVYYDGTYYQASNSPKVLMQDTPNSDIVSITINDKTERVAKESSVINTIIYPNSIEWTNNKGIYYKDGSERSSNTQKCSDYIDISNFIYIRYSRVKMTISSIFGAAFYDANHNYISGIQCKENQDEKGVESYTVNDIPSSAKYIRFTYWMDTVTYGDFELIVGSSFLKDIVDELDDEIKNLVYKITENPSLTQGGVDSIDGSIGSANRTGYTDYIDISNHTGGTLKYKRMCLMNNTHFGIAFYDNNKQYISGIKSNTYCPEDGYEYYETTIPSSAKYLRCSCWLDTETFGIFDACVVDVTLQDAIDDIGALQQTVNTLLDDSEETSYTPAECRNRFYKAMLERCANYNIQDVIIEGPSGYGLGGEVENEVLGHGMSKIPIYGILKIALIASSYPVLCEVMSEDEHIIYTKGVETELTVQRSIYSSPYSNSLTDYYQVLFCKTGSMGGAAINLSAICDSPDFNGNLLLGVVSTNLSGDSNTKSRYKAMKILMDIGKIKLTNLSADVSSLEADLVQQQTRSAAVIVVPKSNTKMYYKTDFINSQYNLYSYNGTMVINPMSMIKYLTAMVTLDYIKDIDKYVEVIQNDITAATGGTGGIFAVNEKVTYRDLIYAMMNPSSNQAGYILARKCGQFLLDNYRGNGFLPET